MKRLIILLIIFLISSCVASKRFYQAESEAQNKATRLESLQKIDVRESIMQSVTSELDLSVIRIVSYYPDKDSITGIQLIKDEVFIEKNINTAITTSVTSEKSSFEVSDVKEEIDAKMTLKEDFSEKKGSSQIKIYLIIGGFLLFILIGMCLYIK